VVDCIKGFLEVNKDPAGKCLIIKTFVDFFNYAEQGMICGVILSEAILILIDDIVFL
jgi:hypothetical protein